jgi:hypothetical protein
MTLRPTSGSGEPNQGAESGCAPDVREAARRESRRMFRFMVHHRHEPQECGVAFASFKGHDSSLRHRAALASCASGGHAIWWVVFAATEADALAQLPFFVAERSTVDRIDEVDIP